MALQRRVVAVFLGVLAISIVLYWVLWFSDRSAVASSSASYYVRFEDAFPLADGLLAVWIALAAWAVVRGWRTAPLFGLLGCGAGLSLFCMDVLFDLEHQIWFSGAGGVVELVINAVTLVSSATVGSWVWRHRREFDAPPTAPGGPDAALRGVTSQRG